MKINYFFFSICFVIISIGQTKAVANDAQIKHLIQNLNSSDWGIVEDAKDSLVQLEKDAIPYLIENLNSENKFVKLQGIADLIYPGATEFYGHGGYVGYDIDWLCIRTGWVLEEMTFKNWGFDEYQDDSNKVAKLKELIAKTNTWWAANSSSWNRLIGVTTALKSSDVREQSNALQFLSNGKGCINGLTKDYFEKELRPTINALLNSGDKYIQGDAKTLLSEVDYRGEFIYNNNPTRCWNK